MHPSRNAFLTDDLCRAIRVNYDPDRNAGRREEEFKTVDPDIQVGDVVVIPTDTRHKATCVKVVAVDIDIDIESNEPIKWIIDRVDMEGYQERVAIEENNNKVLIAARRKALRERVLGEMNDLKGLQSLGDASTPAIENSAAPNTVEGDE